MSQLRIPVRPVMTRPVTLRRGTVVGEIRIYQKLICLAAERTRMLQEERMWSQKRQDFQGQLKAIDDYREDLLKRLELYRRDPPGPQVMKETQEKEQENPQVMGVHPVMEMHY